MWKGDSVSYRKLHSWIRSRKLEPKNCSKCHKNAKLDLANISGQYKRDVDDFIYLCRSCHMKEDGRLDNLIQYKK